MDKAQVIEKLTELKSERGMLGKIEWAVGIPKNNLSGYVNGKKEMPKKWVTALSEYFESGKHLIKGIELPSDYLSFKKIGILKEDGTIEEITNFDQILPDHVLIAKRALDELQNSIVDISPFLEQAETGIVEPESAAGGKTVTITLSAKDHFTEMSKSKAFPRLDQSSKPERLKGETALEYKIRMMEGK